MSKTRIWINDKLELRHSINGWPVAHHLVQEDPTGECLDMALEYEKDLAKAKAESVLLLPPNDGRIVVGDRKLIPDTFIEIEGEVEAGYQWKNTNPGGHGWINVSEKECLRFKEAGYDTRKVARLVHQTKDVNDNELHDANDKDVASIVADPETEMTTCIRLRLDMSAILYDNTASAQEKVITMKELLNKRTSKI